MNTVAIQRDRTESSKEGAEEVARFLECPTTYSDGSTSVTQIQTHISRVFLTKHYAYKLKKPVQFEFLDYSTAERRREACASEVALNRRLAPGVYLGVVPIMRLHDGTLRLDGSGRPVDWVVKMRRLPADSTLDALARQGPVSPSAIAQLASKLTSFYDQLPPVTLTVESYRQGILRHVLANQQELAAPIHQLDAQQIKYLHSQQMRILKLIPELLDDRVRDGRIVEGHGDLRPEHIYFTPTPTIIDCIEFSREFRTVDVIDELAFLEMECDLLGAAGLIKPVFQRYTERSHDCPPSRLVDFYRLYRACVRAKVCSLRAEQVQGRQRQDLLESAREYLDLGQRYASGLGPPLLLVVRGLSGTGKSTIAEIIAGELGFELLQTDAVRRELFGPGDGRDEYNCGRYSTTSRMRVYGEMHDRAGQLLSRGISVVLDGSYLSTSSRADALELARRTSAAILLVSCQCPRATAWERVVERTRTGNVVSEIRPELLDRQQQAEQADVPGFDSLQVDTSGDIAAPRQHIVKALRDKCIT